MAADNNTVTLMACGDIMPIFEPTNRIVELVLPVLKQADLRMGQCELIYSERGWPEYGRTHGGPLARAHPRLSSIWKEAGIDVISLASNHAMDWGPDAMFDTREIFHGMGKQVIGAGKDIDEASKPAILERNGVKVAFVSYCSALRETHAAGKGKPGCAPMRAHTFYSTEDYQAGAPPNVITTPDKVDLEALQENIRRAKQQADVVVMSIHWGLHYIPKTLCGYQPIVAHAAIDAGADLIIGHHAHCLKPVEVYKGKVCFYDVGNFMSTTSSYPARAPSKRNAWGLWWYRIDEECMPPKGIYPYATHSRKSLLVKAVFSKKGVDKVSFLPAYINGKAQPAVMPPSDPKFQEILEYMEWLSDCHPHNFRVEGNEVVVDTVASASWTPSPEESRPYLTEINDVINHVGDLAHGRY